jgi:hypothetical protein
MTACGDFLDIYKLYFCNKENILELAKLQRKLAFKGHRADFSRRITTTSFVTDAEIDTNTITSYITDIETDTVRF